MEFNESTLKGKWTEMRGEIRKAWGKLTDSELDQTKGDLTAIAGLLQQRYGERKEHYSQKLAEMFAGWSEKRDEVAENVKQKLKNEREH